MANGATGANLENALSFVKEENKRGTENATTLRQPLMVQIVRIIRQRADLVTQELAQVRDPHRRE